MLHIVNGLAIYDLGHEPYEIRVGEFERGTIASIKDTSLWSNRWFGSINYLPDDRLHGVICPMLWRVRFVLVQMKFEVRIDASSTECICLWNINHGRTYLPTILMCRDGMSGNSKRRPFQKISEDISSYEPVIVDERKKRGGTASNSDYKHWR